MGVAEWKNQWGTAKKYGTRRDLVSEALSWRWERFWLCSVRRQHREKMGSNGRCVRCGKRLR